MSEPSHDSIPTAEAQAAREPTWLDSPKTHDRIFWVLVAVAVLLVAVDLGYEQHGHFDYETYSGFHAAFGFFAYLGIVGSARLLRMVVKREEDYYGE